MNLIQMPIFFTKTGSLSNLKKQMYKYRTNTPCSTTNQVLSTLKSAPKQLPFLIKVRLVKSIKTTTPVISYHYTNPKTRLLKNLKYRNFLAKNHTSTSKLNGSFILSALLKI